MSQLSSSSVWETIRTIIYAIAITILFRTFFYEPFNIPSGSMKPNLLIGDYLFVSKPSYGYSRYSLPLSLPLIPGRILSTPPERGDVAVFHNPIESRDFIKRIVGLPGDRIQMIKGILHINGTAVKKEPIGTWADLDIKHAGEKLGRNYAYEILAYKETLPNGRSYTVLESAGDEGQVDNTAVFTVPKGHYFGMGDNRDNSTDSRTLSQVGFIAEENFIGEAKILFFSSDRAFSWWQIWDLGKKIRFDRIFDRIR